MNLKKNIIRILAVLILLIIVRNIIPFSKPGIKVTHNGSRVETAEWDYIWVPKNSGGNSGIFDIIPKLAKNIKATTVKDQLVIVNSFFKRFLSLKKGITKSTVRYTNNTKTGNSFMPVRLRRYTNFLSTSFDEL